MIDEIYRAKQGDGYLSFDEIADGLGREISRIYEEIFPGGGKNLVEIFLAPGVVTGTDWGHEPGVLTLQTDSDAITVTDPVIVDCINILAVLATIRNWYVDYSADRAWTHLVGFSQAIAKLRSEASSIKAQYENTPDAGMADIRCLLSIYGAVGAAKKHEPTRALKEWALEESKTMRDSQMDISRKLAARVPGYLANASKNPQRLIYEALRAAQKKPLD